MGQGGLLLLRASGTRSQDQAECAPGQPPTWTEEAGDRLVPLRPARADVEEPTQIIDLIRSTPERRAISDIEETLTDIRGKIEKHIKNTYLKSVQAPAGVKAASKPGWNCFGGESDRYSARHLRH